MTPQITSLQNWRVKNIVKLRSRRNRDEQQMTVIEGIRETRLALQNRVVPREGYICREIIDREGADDVITILEQLEAEELTQLFDVSPEVFAKMAYRGNSGGLILVVPYLRRGLSDLSAGSSSFFVVIEDVEKPGNLGAILRTADAAGVSGLIASISSLRGGTDIHNPNVIRSSLGTLYTVPTVTAPTGQAIAWLKHRDIHTVATTPAATVPYTSVDMTQPIALVMGSESRGLSDEWLSAADERVMIPMHGVVDSLNLAISTALLLYEGVRQRRASNMTFSAAKG